jgi:hypothetical protein
MEVLQTDPTENSDQRWLSTYPAFPGGGTSSPLVLKGGLCGEGVGDGDGDEEKDRDLENKDRVRKGPGGWPISFTGWAWTSQPRDSPRPTENSSDLKLSFRSP